MPRPAPNGRKPRSPASRSGGAESGKVRNRPSALWWLGAGLIFVWAFALGIFVGQGWLATPQQLAALPLIGGWFQGPAASAEAPAPEAKLSYYKELDKKSPARTTTAAAPKPAAKPKLKKPVPVKEKAAQKKSKPVPKRSLKPAPKAAPVRVAKPYVPPPKPKAKKPMVPKTAPAAGPKAAPASMTPDTQEAGKKNASQPQPAKAAYAVQVASFESQTQANRMRDRLKKAGLPAYVRSFRIKDVGVRYRVRVGPYDNFDKAKGAAGRIRLQQQLAAYVTREN